MGFCNFEVNKTNSPCWALKIRLPTLVAKIPSPSIPDLLIKSLASSGLPLTYELRQMDIPVINFTPSKGNDKHARVNAVAPLFGSGMIWAPDQKFADEVIEECAAFPNGDHDDLVDSMTQAVMRFRQGGLITHPEDYVDDKTNKRKRVYY